MNKITGSDETLQDSVPGERMAVIGDQAYPVQDCPVNKPPANRALAIGRALIAVAEHGNADLVALNEDGSLLGITYYQEVGFTPEIMGAMSRAAVENGLRFDPEFKDQWHQKAYPVITINL